MSTSEIITLKAEGKEIAIPVDLVKLTGLSVEANVAAQKFRVIDDVSAAQATDFLSIVVRQKKDADERRKEIVEPFNQFVKRVNALFKPITESLENSERIVKEKILAFRRERERLRQEEEARRQAEAAKAQERENRAAKKENRLPEAIVAPLPLMPAESTLKGSIGSASERGTWKAEITDPKAVPMDQYLSPDVQAALLKSLNAIARATKGSLPIPGVRFYEEKDLAIR